MTSPYTSVSVTNYNVNPPEDDGSQVETNNVKWSTHTTKIGDPLNTAIAAINTNIAAAFDAIYDQTQAEADAGVTPVNYQYEPGNVLRYGTNTTPGTTDMTAAFTNAVASGHDVYFPPGIYALHTDSNSNFPDAPSSAAPFDTYFIQLSAANNGLTISGSGNDSIIRVIGGGQARTGSPAILYFNDCTDITIKNLHFDGNAENTFTSNPLLLENGFAATWFWPTSDGAVKNINIESCYFTKFGNGAINGYGWSDAAYPHFYTDNVNITNCTFEDTGSHGIAASEWRNGRITNCLFKNVGKNLMISGSGSGLGVDLSGGCVDNIISNCIVDGAAGGFKTETHDNGGTAVKAEHNVIDGCIIKNLYTGPDFTPWYGVKLGGDHTILSNTIIEDSHGENVVIEASDCTVSNCHLLGNTLTTDAALLINGQDPRFTPAAFPGNNIITGNYITDSAAQGILCLASNTVIQGNIIDSSGDAGVRIADPNSVGLSTQNVVVSGNIVKDSVGPGIFVDDILSGEEVSNIIITGNTCFDTRSGGSRTQTRGIFYPAFASGTVEVFNIIDFNNHCFNNTIQDYANQSNGYGRMTQGKKILSFSSAPTVGTWDAGDVVFDNTPTAGGTIGWVCVTGGTPGTWKTFGAITA